MSSSEQQIKYILKQGLKLYTDQRISYQSLDRGISALQASFGDSLIYNLMDKVIAEGLANSYTQQDSQQLAEYIRKFYEASDKYPLEGFPEIEYNYSTDTYVRTDQTGGYNMTGYRYIQASNPNRKYKHLAEMQRAIWNLQSTHPERRFDLQSTYTDVGSLARYIDHNATMSEIDTAHRLVIESYKSNGGGYRGRGRPPGSKNKPKFNSNTIDMVIDAIQPETAKDEVRQVEQSTNQDMSNYVTHPQLNNRADKLTADFIQAVGNVQIACDGAFEKLNERIDNIVLRAPTVVKLVRPNLPDVDMGIQHRAFPTLLKICAAQMRNGNRVIPWVYGPAGTGKSTAAEMVAKALSLPFYTQGRTLEKFDVLGYNGVSGYVTTQFRQAYEFGGVFCADEMDSWANAATVALNGALANGHCAFADKLVTRHKDFVMIACANTTGAGATMDYVGRTKMDGATLDRFISLYFPLDEALEDSLVANKDWLRYVRHVRQRANASGINPKPIISPRASIHGEALLAVDLDWQTVVENCLRKGLPDAQWNLIK